MPAIVACGYAGIVLCLLTLAMVTTDEFGYRFIPVLYSTYPWSYLIYQVTNITLIPILLGAAINTLILFFAVSRGIALFRKPSGTK